LLSKHLRHRELGDVDEAFKIRRDKSTEIVNAVVSEGFAEKMPALLTTTSIEPNC